MSIVRYTIPMPVEHNHSLQARKKLATFTGFGQQTGSARRAGNNYECRKIIGRVGHITSRRYHWVCVGALSETKTGVPDCSRFSRSRPLAANAQAGVFKLFSTQWPTPRYRGVLQHSGNSSRVNSRICHLQNGPAESRSKAADKSVRSTQTNPLDAPPLPFFITSACGGGPISRFETWAPTSISLSPCAARFRAPGPLLFADSDGGTHHIP